MARISSVFNICFQFFSFRFPTGQILALQTDENHHGRGYGSLVTKAISKQIASIGHDVYAGIHEQNAASIALFGKLGFERVGTLQTICIRDSLTERR